jgi:pantothenate kinase
VLGLAGIPASGKSSFGKLVIDATNALLRSLTPDAADPHDRAILVGLDGWHLTRAQLDLFPEPQLAHDRRGIHWTFDGSDFVRFVRALREDLTPNTPIITAPSFDHALKDPTPDGISVRPHHCIVLIEGLYTFLSIDPWRAVGELLDERWFLRVDIKEAERRLVKRHVKSGVAKSLDEAMWRAKENDMPSTYHFMSLTKYC